MKACETKAHRLYFANKAACALINMISRRNLVRHFLDPHDLGVLQARNEFNQSRELFSRYKNLVTRSGKRAAQITDAAMKSVLNASFASLLAIPKSPNLIAS